MNIVYPRIGITGGTGFIGSHVFSYLQKHHIPVVLFQGDLLNDNDIRQFFITHKIEQVIHLVGIMGGPPDLQLKINYLTTENLLRIGMDNGLKKILYASSAKVYGAPSGQTSKETDIPSPDTYYGLYKLFSEKCIEYFSLMYGLNYVILRLSNVYGPGNKTGVMYDFESGITRNHEITIIGNGEQKRNLLHVEDACRGIERALYYDKNNVFNIANPVSYSVLEIAAEFKKKYTFTIAHSRADETAHDMIISIDKAKMELAFTPHITAIHL